MARIAGVDLPNKHVNISLTYIYGISRSSAAKICQKSKIDPMRKMNDLNESELAVIREIIDKEYKVEGRLRTEVALNIKRSGYWLLQGTKTQKRFTCTWPTY